MQTTHVNDGSQQNASHTEVNIPTPAVLRLGSGGTEKGHNQDSVSRDSHTLQPSTPLRETSPGKISSVASMPAQMHEPHAASAGTGTLEIPNTTMNPPTSGASKDARMQFLHHQLDRIGTYTAILNNLLLLGDDIFERQQGGTPLNLN